VITPETNEPEAPPIERPMPARFLWGVLGLLCTVIGGIGIVLPGLPTTPFLLLAAVCFSRSSARLYAWLLNLKGFGPAIRDFRAGRGVAMRAKLLALATLWVVVGVSIGLGMPAGWFWPRVGLLVLAGVGTLSVLSLKTRR
jgi:uncharacterized protein